MDNDSVNSVQDPRDICVADGYGLVPVGAWEYLPDVDRYRVAPALRQLLLLPSEVEVDLAESFIPADRERLRALIRVARDVPGDYVDQFVAAGHDGIERPMGLVCRATEDPDRTRVVGVCFDHAHFGWDLARPIPPVESLLESSPMPPMIEPPLDTTNDWEAALRGTNFGLWNWDVESNELKITGSLAELLGYPGDYPLGKYEFWTEFLHPEDRRLTLIALREHLAGRTPGLRIEHRLHHGDGTYHWILSQGVALRNESGEIYRVAGVCTDVTRRIETVRALEESELRLRAIVEGSFEGLLILTAVRGDDGSIVDFRFEQANGQAIGMLRASANDLLGHRLLERYPDAVATGIFDRLCRVVQTQERDQSEVRGGLAHAVTDRTFRQQIVPIPNGVAVVLDDISDERAHEVALQASEKLVSEIARAVPEFLFVMELGTRRITYRNRNIRAAMGYADRIDTSYDQPLLAEMLDAEDQVRLQEIEARIASGKESEPVELEAKVRRADGSIEWIALRQSVFARDAWGRPTHMLGSASIITSRKRNDERLREHVLALNRTQAELQVRQRELESLNQRLEFLATKDGLTNIFNHRAFQERLAEEVARSKRHGHRLSLLMGDVDDFKAFNDRHGHVAGDERLQFFASVLQKCTRPSDFVARYGGEEFTVILAETPASQGLIVAERILQTLAMEGGAFPITASFGLADLNESADTPAALIAAADTALYAAKQAGKNRVVLAHSNASLG